MAAIPSGNLKIFARIEQDSGTTRNSVGEVVESWSEFAAAWMQIVKLSGSELVTAQQIKTNSTHRGTRTALRLICGLNGTRPYQARQPFTSLM